MQSFDSFDVSVLKTLEPDTAAGPNKKKVDTWHTEDFRTLDARKRNGEVTLMAKKALQEGCLCVFLVAWPQLVCCVVCFCGGVWLPRYEFL